MDTTKGTKELSSFIFETKFEDFPEVVLDKAKLVIADTIGVAFKGSLEPEMKRLYDRIPKGGKAVLFREGLPKTNNIAMAGLANATAIAFVELDPISVPHTHGALHVLPAALSLSQFLGKSGADFLTAFILGYETHKRIDNASKLRHKVNTKNQSANAQHLDDNVAKERLVYTHGHSGHIGAVVAVGKLLGWNAEQFRQAINFMASVPLATSWSSCFTNSSVANTFASFSSPMAFLVKDFIESGFTGYNGALEDTYGNILGDEFNPCALTDGLRSDYAVMNTKFKFHATCGVIHPIIEAAADALNYPLGDQYPPFTSNGAININEIKKIKVITGDYRLIPLNTSPEHIQASRFSFPFALAAYLVKGVTSPEIFCESVLNNHEVRSLEKRISLEFDPDFSKKNIAPSLAEVRIEFNDGKILIGNCKEIFGSINNPASQIDIYNKFNSLTSDILIKSEADKIWNMIINIDKQDNIEGIFDV